MKFVYALALMPFAAFANPLETDFDRIFAENAERVVEKNGGASIELDNKVLLSRNGEGKYLGLDGSPHEAVGCVLQLTLQSVAVGKVCPVSLTPEQAEMLDGNLNAFAAFYAENNVPKWPVAEVSGALDTAVEALMQRFENLECKEPQVSQFQEFVATLTSEKTQGDLTESLATPRLPVTQPCL